MTVSHTSVLNLLGKNVQFVWTESQRKFSSKGTVTDVVINLEGNHSISIDSGEFYTFSELLNFEIL